MHYTPVLLLLAYTLCVYSVSVPYGYRGTPGLKGTKYTLHTTYSTEAPRPISNCYFPPDYYPYSIDSYNVTTSIKRRFACTKVQSKLSNPRANESQELCFSIQLPETAFISGLCMEVNNRKYTGVVEEKQKASEQYNKYVDAGKSTAIVESRGMEKFRICMNAGPNSTALFTIEYQHLLVMRLGKVTHSVNIYPIVPVPVCICTILIEEPEGVETINNNIAEVSLDSPERAIISYTPTIEEQQAAITDCGVGFNIDLTTEYTIYPPPPSLIGETSVSENTFIQYFQPTGLHCMCKVFTFIIDVSGSMSGAKIRQTRQAALYLMDELQDDDYFSIIKFSSSSAAFKSSPVSVGDNKEEAKTYIRNIIASGATNIYAGIKRAVRQIIGFSAITDANCVPIIVLMSDGHANTGITDPIQIAEKTQEIAAGHPLSLYTLSFGSGADHNLMQVLAYGNSGRAQRIYEATDATEQLNDFFKTVLCPLLTNINFQFPDSTVTRVSASKFPYYYKGEELIVSGQLITNETVTVNIQATSKEGNVSYSVNVSIQTELGPEAELTCFDEKLNAYLHIRQLLEMLKSNKYENLAADFKKDITEYALQEHFVTELTSIIVHPVKPDADQSCGCKTSCACRQSPGTCVSTTANDDDDEDKDNDDDKDKDNDGVVSEENKDDDDGIKINPSDNNKNMYEVYGLPGPLGAIGAGGIVQYHVLPSNIPVPNLIIPKTRSFAATTTTDTTIPTTTTTIPTTDTTIPTTETTIPTTTPPRIIDCSKMLRHSPKNITTCVAGISFYISARCTTVPTHCSNTVQLLPCGAGLKQLRGSNNKLYKLKQGFDKKYKCGVYMDVASNVLSCAKLGDILKNSAMYNTACAEDQYNGMYNDQLSLITQTCKFQFGRSDPCKFK